jgi:ABC-type nitrate/sulfonate/bicarbonate transport system substrate-binding protein
LAFRFLSFSFLAHSQSIGGGIWMFTLLALDHWGLIPERDKIQFRVVGDQSVLAQAVLIGIVDGAYLGYTFSKIVERQGFHILADLAKLGIPYQGTGVLARKSKSFLNQSPEIAERTLKAMVKAVAYIQDSTNKQSVMQILAKWLRLQSVEDAESGYQMIRVLYDRRIFPTKEGLLNAQRILSKVDPKFVRLKIEDMADDRVVRKLEREGLLK